MVVSLLNALFVPAFADAAAAGVANPSTLSAEVFHDDAPALTSVVCSPDLPPFQTGGTFEARGRASGPYPGMFQESGSVTTTSGATGHVTSYEMVLSFTIDAPAGRVAGTKHSTNFGSGCGPTYDPSSSLSFGTNPDSFVPTDTYTATIYTDLGAFGDIGLFQAKFYSGDPGDPAGGYFDESFQSELESPTALFPTSKAGCKNDTWRSWSIGFKNRGECIAYVKG